MQSVVKIKQKMVHQGLKDYVIKYSKLFQTYVKSQTTLKKKKKRNEIPKKHS